MITATTGGKIISGTHSAVWAGVNVALLGDKATCPKCKSVGTIIEGAKNCLVNGKPTAYDGCVIACRCSPVGSNKIIATNSYIFVDVQITSNSVSNEQILNYLVNDTPTTDAQNNLTFYSKDNIDEPSNIRIDAEHLINCAGDLCTKHLYYPDIQHAFMNEVTKFANEIVYEVETGQKSYEQGSQELKEEEKTLAEQAADILLKGIEVLGALMQIVAGVSLCLTSGGFACVFGVPMIFHGFGNLEQSVGEAVYGKSYVNMTRKGYQYVADFLGYSKEVGDIAFYTVDIGLSIRGMSKLVVKKDAWKLFRYLRDDLERAYKQTSKTFLAMEIWLDLNSLTKIINATDTNTIKVDEIINGIIIDYKTKQSALMLKEPEKIQHATDILDQEECIPYIVITNDPQINNEAPIYVCYKDGKLSRYIY